MNNKVIIFLLVLLCVWIIAGLMDAVAQQNDQRVIRGQVLDQTNKNPLPGANVFLQSDPLTGTSTNEEGIFRLELTNWKQDSLIISFIGYTEKTIPTGRNENIGKIYLQPVSQEIEQAVITGERIIAEEFTIKQMKQLDIYMNPVAKADPLLAVNSMPASTTTDESANISLRGSSPAQTGIFFNNVPIYDAVRFSQLDGIGTFSIFNTAIVKRMHVFPSNPPVEYGNTSSGLIAIQSKDDIPEHNQNNISLSLANLGGQISRKLNSNTGLNVFTNYQPSAGLIGVNERALDDLEHFYSWDLGMHGIHHLSDSSEIKLFNYTNLEGYDYNFRHASFNGIFDMDKKRNFSILNYIRKIPSGEFSVNTGASFSSEIYDYGNTFIDMKKQDLYLNMNYLHRFERLSIKGGFSFDARKQDLDGTFPVYDYAMGEQHPAIDYSEIRKIHLPEGYFYAKYKFNQHWIMGTGARKNIPTNKTRDYLSAQWNLNYKFKTFHSINFALGRYHTYALPNAEIEDITRYQSDQVSLDYKLDMNNILITSALFLKYTEFGDVEETINGAELYSKLDLFQNKISVQGSYTLIDATRKTAGVEYPTTFDLNYYIRGSIKYRHKSNLEVSLITLYRQGTYYQPVTGSEFNPNLNVYDPVYMPRTNKQRLPDYFKLDLSVSKMWPISTDLGIVTFLNVSNLFDSDNVRGKTYNFDYSASFNEYYSKRTVYFGGMIYF